MKKSTILAIAAVAALAAPSTALAGGTDQEGQFIDVAARAVEGVEVLPNPGVNVLLNDGGQVLDSRVRLRWDQNDPNAVERLEWKAQDLRIEDPNDPSEQTAIPAPDGTNLETDIFALTSIQAALAGSPPTILLTTGWVVPEFRGIVEDAAGNPILAEVQDQEAELKVRPADDGSVVPADPTECNVVVLVDDNGKASAASQLDDQDAC
ncbi:MAG TPA: hypothetical protein VGJ70_10145 [Solirubrobacteraceae bacterium]